MRKKTNSKIIFIGLNVEPELAKQLDAIREALPYQPSRSSILREALINWLASQKTPINRSEVA